MQLSRRRRAEKRGTFRHLTVYASDERRRAFPPCDIEAASYQPASALTVSVIARSAATRQFPAVRTALAALDCRAASGSR